MLTRREYKALKQTVVSGDCLGVAKVQVIFIVLLLILLQHIYNSDMLMTKTFFEKRQNKLFTEVRK